MNPFFIGPDIKLMKEKRKSEDERFSKQEADSVQAPSPLALRLGHLLIRMGSKLAHENKSTYTPGHIVS